MRSVEQREPLLGLKRDRLEADLGEAGGGGRNAISQPRLPDADHRRRHMGERGEIARRADEPLRRHNRGQAAGEHSLDEANRPRLDA